MPDKRVSELTAVVVPSGTDEFPCNQGGTTKKETRTQITATVAADLATHMASSPATHANNSITDALLRQGAGASVMGRAAAGAGNVADIAAGADNTALSRLAGTLAFRTLATIAGTFTRIMPIPIYVKPAGEGATMADGVTCQVEVTIRVPADYAGGGHVIWNGYKTGGLAGNCYRQMSVNAGAIGESYSTHSYAVALGIAAIGNSPMWSVVADCDISAAVTAGDNLTIFLERQGGHANDSLNSNLVAELYLSYTANLF